MDYQLPVAGRRTTPATGFGDRLKIIWYCLGNGGLGRKNTRHISSMVIIWPLLEHTGITSLYSPRAKSVTLKVIDYQLPIALDHHDDRQYAIGDRFQDFIVVHSVDHDKEQQPAPD